MRLLLSGAKHYLSEQKSPQNSIGGFMSSTSVPNGRINNIFTDVSTYGKNKGVKDCFAFFLLNDKTVSIKNLKMRQVVRTDFACKFEWAAVIPAMGETISVERMSNSREEPYNAEFFEPTTIREFQTLTVKTGGTIGENVSLLGVNFVVTGVTLENLLDDIVKAFEDNEDFYVRKVDSLNFFIERTAFTITGALISLVTAGSASLFDLNFAGGVDGTTDLVDEIKPGEALAFWVKRTIKKSNCENDSCVELSCLTDVEENLEVYFIFD